MGKYLATWPKVPANQVWKLIDEKMMVGPFLDSLGRVKPNSESAANQVLEPIGKDSGPGGQVFPLVRRHMGVLVS
jgi:hypothetical protein